MNRLSSFAVLTLLLLAVNVSAVNTVYEDVILNKDVNITGNTYMIGNLSVFDLNVRSGQSLCIANACFGNEGLYTSVDTDFGIKLYDEPTAFFSVNAYNNSAQTVANIMLSAGNDTNKSVFNLFKVNSIFSHGGVSMVNEDGRIASFVQEDKSHEWGYYDTLLRDEFGNAISMTGLTYLILNKTGMNLNGTITANYFIGDGSLLTGTNTELINYYNKTQLDNMFIYYSSSGLCYQESWNVSNQTGIDGNCGLDYTGSSYQNGLTDVGDINDGNWTNGILFLAGDYYLFNYTKPSNALSTSFLKISNYNNTFVEVNLSIPLSCWDYDSTKLMFKIEPFVAANAKMIYKCYDGTWKTISEQDVSITMVTEEAMWWDIQNLIGDNSSWNQILADSLYASIGYGDDWNKSYADSLYLDMYDDILVTKCYQESSSTSNQTGIDGNCNLNYSGSHSSGIGANAYDGDWNTYATGGYGAFLYMDYVKPSNVSGAILKTKSDIDTYEIVIPDSCFNYNDTLLQLALYSDSAGGSGTAYTAFCRDQTTWTAPGIFWSANRILDTTGGLAHMYEGAVIWVTQKTSLDNSSWNESYADGKYYPISNPFGFYNITNFDFNDYVLTSALDYFTNADETDPLWTSNKTNVAFTNVEEIFPGNVTVEGIKFEEDTTNHRIYDNSTCIIIEGDTSTMYIC